MTLSPNGPAEEGVSETPSRSFPPWVGATASLGLGAMVLLPLLDKALGGVNLRSESWVQNLTLWVGLFGAFLASWRGRHLCIAVGEAIRSGPWKARFDFLSRAGTIAILICLSVAATKSTAEMFSAAQVGLSFNQAGGWVPLWVALIPMPIAFVAMALVTFWRKGEGWAQRMGILGLAVLLGPALVFLPYGVEPVARVLGIGGLILLAGMGMPLFAALGGAALLLFFLAGTETAVVPYAVYQISSEFFLPTVPLFALAGVVLARGGAPARLVRLTRAWTGWAPGGAAIATILACAFFTAISGASGVTILALGGLLLPVLLAAKHSERFSLGLLTASGSVGLLFPPSIPVFMYAVKGQVYFQELFLAGLVPGVLLLAFLAGFCLFQVRGQWQERPRFDSREALAAIRVASGDLLLVVIVLVAIFTALLGLVQSAALAAFGAIVLEVVVHRKVDLRRELPAVLVEACLLVGALIAIICMAFGVSQFLLTEEVPGRIAGWVTTYIHSKWTFLLVLNLLLLAVGALMDIFSAIVIVVPLIIPLAEYFGVGFTHLGIVFLANLELGYLTPPVGLNLFLSSLTFDKPLLKVWRAALPFLAIFALWVILVTYVPWLSEGVVNLVKGTMGI